MSDLCDVKAEQDRIDDAVSAAVAAAKLATAADVSGKSRDGFVVFVWDHLAKQRTL